MPHDVAPFYALGVTSLRNRYFGLRHGFSEANAIDLVVSHPDHGLGKWGLSELGRAQVTSSVEAAAQDGLLDESTEIHTSDFLRARESSDIAQRVLGASYVYLEKGLRERDFGKLELTCLDLYREIWQEDSINPNRGIWGVESATSVMKRTTELVAHLERACRDKTILLVSHGDTLQILQCGFDGLPARAHKDVQPFKAGEIRELRLGGHEARD